jgi:DNA modification methylase
MAWTLNQAGVPPGATVIDPYMGAGSTGVACIRSGRSFVGMEKNERYFKTAKARIDAALKARAARAAT